LQNTPELEKPDQKEEHSQEHLPRNNQNQELKVDESFLKRLESSVHENCDAELHKEEAQVVETDIDPEKKIFLKNHGI
jgi:hypothetical protein